MITDARVSESKVTPRSKAGKGALGRTGSDALLLGGSLIGLLAVWELVVDVLNVPAVILPAPSEILASLWAILISGLLPKHLGITLAETFAGFFIGTVVGIGGGALIAESRTLYKILYPYIVAFQSLPKVAIAPLLVVWFGFGIESKIVMTALISFFPILVNTMVGLSIVDQDYLDLMKALMSSPLQVFRYVRLPSALPYIFAGLEVGIVLSVIGAIVGEFVGASSGIGYLIMQYNAQLNVSGVFALLVILAVLGIVLSSAISWLRRRVAFWADPGVDRFTGA